MTIDGALRRGWDRSWGRKRFVPLVYLVHLLTVLVPALLFFRSISGAIGHVPVSDRLSGGLDLSLLTDLLYHSRAELGMAFSSLWAVLPLVIAVDAFLDGGLLTVLLKREDDPGRQGFFAGCGRFVLPFLRLAVLSIPLLVIAFFAHQAFGKILDAVRERFSDEVVSFVLTAVNALFFLLLMGIVNLVLDYAKISLVAGAGRSALRHLGRSLAFIWGRKAPALALYALLALLVLLLHGAYGLLSGLLSPGTWAGLLLLILLQQLLLLSRTWMRFLAFSAQGIYFVEAGVATPATAGPVPITEPLP